MPTEQLSIPESHQEVQMIFGSFWTYREVKQQQHTIALSHSKEVKYLKDEGNGRFNRNL